LLLNVLGLESRLVAASRVLNASRVAVVAPLSRTHSSHRPPTGITNEQSRQWIDVWFGTSPAGAAGELATKNLSAFKVLPADQGRMLAREDGLKVAAFAPAALFVNAIVYDDSSVKASLKHVSNAFLAERSGWKATGNTFGAKRDVPTIGQLQAISVEFLGNGAIAKMAGKIPLKSTTDGLAFNRMIHQYLSIRTIRFIKVGAAIDPIKVRAFGTLPITVAQWDCAVPKALAGASQLAFVSFLAKIVNIDLGKHAQDSESELAPGRGKVKIFLDRDKRDPGGVEYALDLDGDGKCKVHCNTMECTWSWLRQMLRTYRGVSKVYLPLYVAQFEFLFNRRHKNRWNRTLDVLQAAFLVQGSSAADLLQRVQSAQFAEVCPVAG